jgi:cyclic di-GMP phosphodiesterase
MRGDAASVRILLVDDDAGLRALLRATFEGSDVEVDEAESAAAAAREIARARPDVIVLDIRMPGMDGLEFCRVLKRDPETAGIPVVLLTGASSEEAAEARHAGAEALLHKPFSPLELLGIVERLAGGLHGVPFQPAQRGQPGEELLLYARDLRHMLELERGQRALVQDAYRQTITALATALESKDTGTRAHSQRVQHYALALASNVDPRHLGHEPSIEYGFLLHDVGKIGIPDSILLKEGPLNAAERRRMQTHTILGEQMLGGVAFLQGEGLRVVRSHHERWDGAGYPDGLAGEDIPLAARVFAVADALDAMTSDRPYREALPWGVARGEIEAQSGLQFDPEIVHAFAGCENDLRDIHAAFAAAAA